MIDSHKSTRLGDLLVERKVITRDQLHQAIELQQTRRFEAAQGEDGRHHELGEILIELGFINRAQLKTGLGWQRRIRKATAVMIFVAPLFTAACGGGGGGGGSSNPVNNNQSNNTQTVSSLSVSSAPASEAVVDTPTSAAVSSAIMSSSSSSVSSLSPVLSSSSFSSAVLGGLPNSSSSSSAAPVQSSSAAFSSDSSQLSGPVQIYWNAPNKRENGEALDITELGGYELRYKRKSDAIYTNVVINDPYTDAYYFDYLEGEYEFQIAAFDSNGLYSSFVAVSPGS